MNASGENVIPGASRSQPNPAVLDSHRAPTLSAHVSAAARTTADSELSCRFKESRNEFEHYVRRFEDLPASHEPDGNNYSEDFHRDVLFLSIEDATHTPFPEPVKYGEVARLGRAMIDPHCPINIVSKEFFERLNTPFIEFSALEKERPFFRTILNEEVRMLGQSRISWRLANSQPRRSGTDNFKFKNGFTESTFYIFDTRLFNCIIGSATINQHQLATCVAAPAFYCYPPKISESTNADWMPKHRRELAKAERVANERHISQQQHGFQGQQQQQEEELLHTGRQNGLTSGSSYDATSPSSRTLRQNFVAQGGVPLNGSLGHAHDVSPDNSEAATDSSLGNAPAVSQSGPQQLSSSGGENPNIQGSPPV